MKPTHTPSLLLTMALLAACGTTEVPGTPSAPDAVTLGALSLQSQPLSTGRDRAYSTILTVEITPDTTERDLRRQYPGSRLLSHQPARGRAILAVNSYARNKHILAAEDNATLTGLSTDVVEAQGYSLWAGGYSLWAGGYSLWAGGTTKATTFVDNADEWNTIKLLEGQALAPNLGRGVKVAVVDTGVDHLHTGLTGKVDTAAGYDYFDLDADAQEVNANTDGTFSGGYGHGTAVAGLILQVAPEATIIPLRVLGPNGAGTLDGVIAAIDHAVRRGAQVINLSLGATVDSTALTTAVTNAVQAGSLVVSSSGNTGDLNVTFPARKGKDLSISGLISVGSVDPLLQKSPFSTYGGGVEIAATGQDVMTLFPGGLLVSSSGTSFAAPIVAGTAALAYGQQYRSPATLKSALLRNAQPAKDLVFGSQLGSGVLNVHSFLNAYNSIK